MKAVTNLDHKRAETLHTRSAALSVLLMAVALIACDSKQSKKGSTTLSHSGNAPALDATCVDSNTLITNAQSSLQTYCYSCHGANGNSPANPQNATDLADLVATGMIIPNNTTGSPLLLSISSGKMPPAGSPQMTPDSLTALNDWVTNGAPTAAGGPSTCTAVATATTTPAGGTTTATAASSTTPAAGGGTVVDNSAVQTILSNNCASCHGASGKGGLSNITDLQGLVTQGVVSPGSLKWSVLYARISSADKPMPPAPKSRLADADIQTIGNWIVSLGAPAPGGGNPGVAGANPAAPANVSITKTVQPTDVFTLVAQDLQRLAATNLGLAPFTRYVSFAHLVSPGDPLSKVLDYDDAFGRVLNSLSTNPQIQKPAFVDQDGLVLRFDVRDYNWTQQDWEMILHDYPYASLQRSQSAQSTFQSLAQTSLPIVNGDWFLFTVTQFPLYNNLLRLPGSVWGLQQWLGFNISQNFSDTINGVASRDTQVLRAGFAISKVTLSNRVLERHAQKNGAYWDSYDFISVTSNDPSKDIFANPLGPVGLNVHAFRQDASEIIFNLPNGLQAYFIADANNNFLRAALLNIAQDPNRRNRVIENGYSCMECHAAGLLARKDEVAGVAASRASFSADDLTFINRFYGQQDALDAAYNGDTQEHMTALLKASFSNTTPKSLVAAGNVYETDMTAADAAAMLGISVQTFNNLLLTSQSTDLKNQLAGFVGGSTVPRATFEAQFPNVVSNFLGNLPAP